MRFETTSPFDADWARLTPPERQMFKRSVRAFSEACDRFVDDPSGGWPGSLRIRKVEGARGIYEMTWSFSGPDGRATWEWVTVEVAEPSGEGGAVAVRRPAVRWRRVGTHRVFSNP